MTAESQIPLANLDGLQELCASTPDGGAVVELGVYKGGSAYALSKVLRGRELHLFDTFKGIPEKGPGDAFDIGSFGDVDVEGVRKLLPFAIFHVGVFPRTLGLEPKDISFAHIDCDQGATCEAAITFLWPRVIPGGIMAFDDYPFEGIRRAIHANFKDSEIKFTKTNIPYVKKEIK